MATEAGPRTILPLRTNQASCLERETQATAVAEQGTPCGAFASMTLLGAAARVVGGVVLGVTTRGFGLVVVWVGVGEGESAAATGDADAEAEGVGDEVEVGVSGFASAAGAACVCAAQAAVMPARASAAPEIARTRGTRDTRDIRRNRLTHFVRGPWGV